MKKLALIFPGQGSQYIGMGKSLYNKYECAKEIYDKADEILARNLKELIFNGNEEDLKQTENAQTAIFVTSMAAYEVFKDTCEVQPVVAAGHSLGEISALTAAGIFSFEEALRLVQDRAQYMKKATLEKSGKMFAIRNIYYSTVEEICKKSGESGITVISNYNSANQVVISGDSDKASIVAEKLKEKGALITELKVSGAFHSPLMESAYLQMNSRLEGLSINKPLIPVIANVNGEFYQMDSIKDNLARQIISPVQWHKTVNLFEKMGVNATVELGPGKVLSNLVSSTAGNIETYMFEKEAHIEHAINELNVRYKSQRPNLIQKCISVAICTQNTNENEEEYKEGVVKPVEELKSLSEKLGDSNISSQDKEYALTLVKKILDTKGVSAEEKMYRIDEISRWC